MSILKIVKLNGKDYLCFGGYVSKKRNTIYCRIHSVVLNKLFDKISNFKIEPVDKDGYILIKKSENGRGWYKVARGLQFSMKKLQLGTIKVLFDPIEFGLDFLDFGILTEMKRNKIISNSPKLWVRGLISSSKRITHIIFNISRNMAGKFVTVLPKKDKIILKRIQPKIILKSNVSGVFRKLTGKHRKYSQRNELYISARGLLKDISNRYIWIGVYPKEWENELDIGQLFAYTEERELAKILYVNGLTIFASHSKGFFDIGIGDNNGNLKNVIEVTNDKPIKQGNSMYGSKGAGITAKIQTIRLWCIKNKKLGFLVLNKDWSKLGWIKKLVEESKRDSCIILFTDFDRKWPIKIANKIMSYLEN